MNDDVWEVTHPLAPATRLVGRAVGGNVLSLPGGTYTDITLDPAHGWVWVKLGGDADPSTDLHITDTAQAEFWAKAHHRMLCRDADQIVQLAARLRVLETPWWKPLARARARRWLR